jgi:MFS transporter, ACS family, hexuronate transporter
MAPSHTPPPPPTAWYERNWRWFVLGMLFYATFLNYLDRQTLAIAMEPISRELGLDNVQRGNLLAAFVYAYAASHLVVGFMIDRVRSIRWFFPAAVIGWSAATIGIGLVRDYSSILWLRYALGVFESVNFPLCFLLIARIFPARQRAFAVGVFTSGAILATLVAPKSVIYFAENHDWHWAFLVNGSLGISWLVPWLLIFRNPERRAEFWPDAHAASQPADSVGKTLQSVVGSRGFWAVAGMGIGIIPGLYFMTQWLPSYFTLEWKVAYNQALGNRLVLIYLMQDLGSIIGGLAAWYLIGRGISVLRARKLVIAFAYVCTLAILLLPAVKTINGVVMLAGVYIFGLAMWISNHGAFKQEVRRRHVATVAALVGFIETGFAAFVVDRVGSMTQAAGGFAAVFALLAGFLTFAFLCAMFLIRPRWMEMETPSAGPSPETASSKAAATAT